MLDPRHQHATPERRNTLRTDSARRIIGFDTDIVVGLCEPRTHCPLTGTEFNNRFRLRTPQATRNRVKAQPSVHREMRRPFHACAPPFLTPTRSRQD